MKIRKFWFIPMILIIVSIVSSIVAFHQSNLLNLGYLYVDEEAKTTVYEGEYVAIIGNTSDAYYMSVSLQDDFIELVTYGINNTILDKYHITISKDGTNHDASMVSSNVDNDILRIDEMDEYAFIFNLEKNETYIIDMEVTHNDPFTDDIDLVLVHIPEHIYNLKTLMEGLAVSTLIFAIISTLTIASILFFKRD